MANRNQTTGERIAADTCMTFHYPGFSGGLASARASLARRIDDAIWVAERIGYQRAKREGRERRDLRDAKRLREAAAYD